MSTVGLTKAMRRVVERPNGLDHSVAVINRAVKAGLIAFTSERGSADGKTYWINAYVQTPRGHAALAAPRMTDEQYTALALIEGHGEAVVTHPRVYVTFVRNGWVSHRHITPAGRTALNNVRAAMGSQDWKEGL